MSQISQAATALPETLELKAGAFSLFSLRLGSTDATAVAAALQAKIAQAPRFFESASAVLDLDSDTDLTDSRRLAALCRTLSDNGLTLVGAHGGAEPARRAAREAGLAVLTSGFRGQGPAREAAPRSRGLRVVSRSIRSGQQVHAAGADLVVFGAVSAGAEILADGHIHVYGALRGRALAGLDGDTGARIFCQKLEAELLSIAGNYRVLDQIEPALYGAAVQAYLDGDKLCLEATATTGG